MMLAIFATLSFALLGAYLGRRRCAAISALACLGLSVGLFLFEIHSHEYGFRMPWLQLDVMPQLGPRGRS